MRTRAAAFAIACLALAHPLSAQPAARQNAADLYAQAATQIVVRSPAASNLQYPDHPPFGAEWTTLARDAWEKNAPARAIAHAAASTPAVRWPAGDDRRYLSGCRDVANELGDAALHRGLDGDPAAAIGFLRDLLALGDHLRPQDDDERLIRALVAAGSDAVAASRTLMLAPDLAAAEPKDVRSLIDRLLALPDPDAQIATLYGGPAEVAALRADPQDRINVDRYRTTFARVAADRRMAAMSLACQLYRRDKGAWPARADDLVPAYLASVPIDPSDGKPLGYAVIAKGLPDGGDRPLVYSREESRDGLAYRTDAPQFGFYTLDGSNRPSRDHKKAGQFRDVARWSPAKPHEPTERPALVPLP